MSLKNLISLNSHRIVIERVKKIYAIVAPIGLQSEFLKAAGNKPVIMAVSDRVLVPDENGGEDKVEFRFKRWEQLQKIEVVKSMFAD